jgi:hypothetical protein
LVRNLHNSQIRAKPQENVRNVFANSRIARWCEPCQISIEIEIHQLRFTSRGDFRRQTRRFLL